MTFTKTSLIAACFMLQANVASAVPFDIQIDFSGDASFQSAFDDAANQWEGLITGYQNDNDLGPLIISASVADFDGVGGKLGLAGPTGVVTTDGFTYATSGIMQFDVADMTELISAGLFSDVVLHEMAHVMGFGTLWDANGVYANGTGAYTGAAGLAAYQDEFDPDATFVPVELDGGQGTANAHWDEDWAGGSDALMTGFLNLEPNSNAPVLSETTIQSFADIGFEVRDFVGPTPTIVPLPAGGLFLASALTGLAWTRRRKTT